MFSAVVLYGSWWCFMGHGGALWVMTAVCDMFLGGKRLEISTQIIPMKSQVRSGFLSKQKNVQYHACVCCKF